MKTQEDNTNSQLEAGPSHLIPESTYDYDHPKVVYWTQRLHERAAEEDVHANVALAGKFADSRAMAETVAAIWNEFTRHVPIFLMRAAAQASDPERQHHLIQIAYDELGGRDKELIHSKLFLEALAAIGIHLSSDPSACAKSALDMLDETLVAADSEEGLIGLLLSFEIVAEENIEMLFECLAFDGVARETLSATPFFEIHRQNETEHIRHAVANFVRFCKTEGRCEHFMRSFDEGIEFWQRFWDQAARLINATTTAATEESVDAA